MEEAYRAFIKNNLALFLQKSEAREEWKLAKQKYFVERIANRVGVPRNPELARLICEYLIDSHVIGDAAKLDEISSQADFLRRFLTAHDHEELARRLTGSSTPKPVLTNEDLRQIHQEDYRKRKVDELTAEASATVQVRLAEVEQLRSKVEDRYRTMLGQLEEGRKQLEEERRVTSQTRSAVESYSTSSLEDIPYSVEGTAASGNVGASVVWWDRLGLKSNPFPTVDGLSEIDEEYHDDVVLRTPVFNHYHDLVMKAPTEFFGKTHIVIGEFGSGKTTLFDFLRKPLLTKDIMPIHLLIDAEHDVDTIRRSFFRALVHDLAPDIYLIDSDSPLLGLGIIGKEEISDAFKAILEKKELRGILIMLDGLHKNDGARKSALSFIQTLQNTRDYWVRSGIRTGFLIAGSPTWGTDLSLDPVTRGSIDHVEIIGPISSSDAHEMLTKRLAAFSKDPKRPARIRRAAVDRACRQLKEKYPRDLTFRDVVDDILPYLEKTDSGFVEISLPFDKPLLESLRKRVGEFSEFSAALERLKRNPTAFLPALQVLSILLERGRVSEAQPIFKDNSPLFAILSKAELIQSIRVQGLSDWYWIPSKAVLNYAKKIELEVGHPPSEFLYEMFVERPEYGTNSIDDPEVETTRQLISAFSTTDRSLVSALETAAAAHQPILRHAKSPTDIIPRRDLIATTMSSVDNSLKCFYLVTEPRDLAPFGGRTAIEWLGDSYVAPPEVFEYWKETGAESEGNVQARDAPLVVRAYLRAYRSVIRAIDLSIRLDAFVNLRTNLLSRTEKVTLNQARMSFFEGKFFDCTRTYTDLAEGRLRAFLYTVLVLKYGPKWRARLGAEANAYVADQKRRQQSSSLHTPSDMNELYSLSRQHYRPIISEVQGNWDQIFGPCFHPEPKASVDSALRSAFLLSDRDKHNLPDDYFRQNSDKVLSGLQATAQLLRAINTAYPRLLSENGLTIEDVSPDKVRVFFSFLGGHDRSNLNPVVLSRDDGNKFAKRLESRLRRGPALVDMSDVGSVSGLIDGGYREAVSVIALGRRKGYLSIEPKQPPWVEVRLVGHSSGNGAKVPPPVGES